MKYSMTFIALLLSTAATWAQQVPASALDGIIAEGEYQTSQIKDGFTIATRLSADGSTLQIAVSAQTTGWLSIGLGSRKMDGSFMILGYVSDGKPSVSYELGKGYSHAPTPAPGVTSFVAEAGGVTTLEVSLPASRYIKSGLVQTIAAFGNKDDFRSKHSKRTSLELKL